LSIGISLFPENGNNYNDLLKNSDSAMYEAKNNGRNNFKFFSQEMNEIAQKRLELDTRLHRAVQCHDFFLVYQPKFSYRHQECIGFEALIRWNDSTLGFVPPDLFIPIAEQSGYIYEIGLWVLSKAFKDIQQINQEMGVRYSVAVNISGKQLEDARFLDDLKDLIQTTKIDTECIEFEITETSVMQSIDQMLPILFKIKFLGIKLSIDDFGTGYSSMAYLKKMPIDILKIDREFISNITTDLDDIAIVKSTISLAKTFKLDLVAEGVETEEHAAILQEMGCDSYQGYYYSKPLELSALINFLCNQCNQAGNITQLVYASKATQNMGFDEVSKILDVAHEQNPKHSLTGCLMHNSEFFLQIIEGPDNEIKQLMHNIHNDKRHNEIKLLGTKQIMQRDFNGWNMGYINNSQAIQNLLLKFTGKKIFDPYTLTYEEAKSLILGLSKVV
jgi:EAL domain-containing protein (putative c-di-GMP-specific phosphodiesterase class I)